MKDDFSCKTDMLDHDEQSDEFIVRGPLTDLQTSSDSNLDLLSDWHSDGDTGAESIHLYDRLLQSNESRSSHADSATYVPERGQSSILGSLLQESFIGDVSRTAPVDRLALPGLNDVIFGFRLLHELGTGSFAKVFLAKQGDLADREVVLKVSGIEGSEPQTLAQLQHTHVVPIYSVHEDFRNGLRAVCMPYFGGASLSKVLDKVWAKKPTPVSGQDLVEALDRVAGPEPATRASQHATLATSDNPESATPSGHTARDTLAGLSYVQAAVWTICRLAEGLQHSHERNVIHRDIKPSNILMSAEGQPLLLDFNVSQTLECIPHDTSLGGTIAYMAPEHLRAAMSHDAANIPLVNQRSDIYSLGLVLYELLSGASPFVKSATASMAPQHLDAILTERERPVPSLKKNSRLEIPWSLESIVRKCLAVEPRDRYASAAQFAEDLNRFLLDQPLKYAPELSRREQIGKWARRHPRLTTTALAALIAAMFIIPGGVILGNTQRDLRIKKELLDISKASEVADDFRDSAPRALSMINTITPNEDTLPQGIKECESALGFYKVLDNSNWQDGINWRLLNHTERTGLAETVRELLIVLAKAQVRKAPGNSVTVHRALSLLETAERVRDLNPSRLLLEDRATYLSLLNRDEEARQVSLVAAATPATSAHDRYMLAANYARQDDVEGYREAVKLLTAAIKHDPSHYWSYFQRALCYQALHQPTQAASDLGICIALWPQSSWAHFNRGHLLDRQGQVRDAIADYTESIRLSPEFQSAHFNRGLAHLELRNYAEALKDFDTVVALGRNDEVVIAGRAIALEGLGRHHEADEQFAKVLGQISKAHDDRMERISWTYAFAISARKPDVAQRVFDDILRGNDRHPQAWYGQGMLLMQKNELEKAIHSFDEAIKAKANFMEPLRYRAICFARLGKFTEAASEIDGCVEMEPTNPESHYAAACVAAISFHKLHDPELADVALAELQQAIVCGADKARAITDPDFSALHFDPDFMRITGSDVPKASPKPAPEL